MHSLRGSVFINAFCSTAVTRHSGGLCAHRRMRCAVLFVSWDVCLMCEEEEKKRMLGDGRFSVKSFFSDVRKCDLKVLWEPLKGFSAEMSVNERPRRLPE